MAFSRRTTCCTVEILEKIDRNALCHAEHKVIGYVEHFSRSHDAVIRVYDETGNVIVAAIFRSEMECGAALVAIFKGAT